MNTKMTPLQNDVLLRKSSRQSYESNIIHVQPDGESQMVFFEVVAVGEKVRSVIPGQTVIVPWTRVTDPFTIDDEPMGLTAEKEILGVVEDE